MRHQVRYWIAALPFLLCMNVINFTVASSTRNLSDRQPRKRRITATNNTSSGGTGNSNSNASGGGNGGGDDGDSSSSSGESSGSGGGSSTEGISNEHSSNKRGTTAIMVIVAVLAGVIFSVIVIRKRRSKVAEYRHPLRGAVNKRIKLCPTTATHPPESVEHPPNRWGLEYEQHIYMPVSAGGQSVLV